MKKHFLNKEEMVDSAWEGFLKSHEPDTMKKFSEIAKDKEEAAIAGWRLGFFYCLLSMEKGIISIQNIENN